MFFFFINRYKLLGELDEILLALYSLDAGMYMKGIHISNTLVSILMSIVRGLIE